MLALWLYKVCMLQASRSYLSWAAHKNLRSACWVLSSEFWDTVESNWGQNHENTKHQSPTVLQQQDKSIFESVNSHLVSKNLCLWHIYYSWPREVDWGSEQSQMTKNGRFSHLEPCRGVQNAQPIKCLVFIIYVVYNSFLFDQRLR